MQLLKASALCLLALSEVIDGRPNPYWTKQRLLNEPQAPLRPNGPYHPGHQDKYDRKIDPEKGGLDPLPYRNGDGASVLGPWNRERSRQNPDLVRPPSTDHGTLKNMRWSFADSHIRIEVSELSPASAYLKLTVSTGRWLDTSNHSPRTPNKRRACWREHAS